MQIIDFSSSVAEIFRARGCTVALGFFDGVHLAHRELISKAVTKAKMLGIPSVVFTFPSECESLKASSPRLYSTDDKLSLIAECGIDYVLLTPFAEIAALSASDFIKQVLIDMLNVKYAVFGYNFRFGKGRSGDGEMLRRELALASREGELVRKYSFEEHTLSTTFIRELLSEGRLAEANTALGKPYFICGSVSHGLGEGRTYGIPTVNIDFPHGRYILPRGVYASAVVIDGRAYRALTNIGVCPTFGERQVHAETFILDYEGDLYESVVQIYFFKFIREERLFSDANELKKQINIDKNEAYSLDMEEICQVLGLK